MPTTSKYESERFCKQVANKEKTETPVGELRNMKSSKDFSGILQEKSIQVLRKSG